MHLELTLIQHQFKAAAGTEPWALSHTAVAIYKTWDAGRGKLMSQVKCLSCNPTLSSFMPLLGLCAAN